MSDDASLPAVRRRRWPRIVALLFFLAMIGGFVFWLVKPETTSATALFEVRHASSSVLGSDDGPLNDKYDYEILKKTQIAKLKSKYLMQSALRNPNVAGSPIFAGIHDPEQWLQDHLEVEYPQNGELLAISLSGKKSQAPDLRVVVDAVAEAYKKEVLGGEQSRQLNLHDMLEHSLQNLQTEIKRKSEDYLDISKGMGRPESNDSSEFQRQLDLKRMDRIDEELAQLDRDRLKMTISEEEKESKYVDARIEQLLKHQKDLERSIQRRYERSADLESRGEELKQLQQIANDMNLKLEKLDIESQSPGRIRQVQTAVIDDGKIAGQ